MGDSSLTSAFSETFREGGEPDSTGGGGDIVETRKYLFQDERSQLQPYRSLRIGTGSILQSAMVKINRAQVRTPGGILGFTICGMFVFRILFATPPTVDIVKPPPTEAESNAAQ
jgi:hypothetical protein